jgi:hypothetical protein
MPNGFEPKHLSPWESLSSSKLAVVWLLIGQFAIITLQLINIWHISPAVPVATSPPTRPEEWRYKVLFEGRNDKLEVAVPGPGRAILTEEKMVQEFVLAGYPQAELSKEAQDVLRSLLRYDIVTDDQLHELLASHSIIDSLKHIYVKYQQWAPDRPLDPESIAKYGSFLFVYGLGSGQLQTVTDAIRSEGQPSH